MTDDNPASTHTVDWCDTDSHVLPVPDDVDDPGCHRLAEAGGWTVVAMPDGDDVIFSTEGPQLTRLADVRAAHEAVGDLLALIPVQRTA